MHAPQCHWHAAIAEGFSVVAQEAREHIVSILGLLNRFGHRTEQREEELWAHAERVAKGSYVVRLVEPLDERLMRLEMHMRDVQADVTKHQSRINVERVLSLGLNNFPSLARFYLSRGGIWECKGSMASNFMRVSIS